MKIIVFTLVAVIVSQPVLAHHAPTYLPHPHYKLELSTRRPLPKVPGRGRTTYLLGWVKGPPAMLSGDTTNPRAYRFALSFFRHAYAAQGIDANGPQSCGS